MTLWVAPHEQSKGPIVLVLLSPADNAVTESTLFGIPSMKMVVLLSSASPSPTFATVYVTVKLPSSNASDLLVITKSGILYSTTRNAFAGIMLSPSSA